MPRAVLWLHLRGENGRRRGPFALAPPRVDPFDRPLDHVVEHRREEDAEGGHAEHPVEDGRAQRPPHLRPGPFGEDARQAIREHLADIARWVDDYHRLAATTAEDIWVVTHGEPHAGNVIRTSDGPMLIDWDTVALAPPERDLWMLVDAGLEAVPGAAGSSEPIDGTALRYFRLRWLLNDIAAFTEQLRSSHEHTEDAIFAHEILPECLTSITRELLRNDLPERT